MMKNFIIGAALLALVGCAGVAKNVTEREPHWVVNGGVVMFCEDKAEGSLCYELPDEALQKYLHNILGIMTNVK